MNADSLHQNGIRFDQIEPRAQFAAITGLTIETATRLAPAAQ
jgi:hypothetical protein